MLNKKWTTISFFILVLVQLAVPSFMILTQEEIQTEGKAFRFKTRPVDPYDLFRGKYITLTFENQFIYLDPNGEPIHPDKIEENATTEFQEQNSEEYQSQVDTTELKFQKNDNVFIVIDEDENGYAFISDISKQIPDWTVNYIQVFVKRVDREGRLFKFTVNLPFKRFYMNEAKAYEAEKAYNETQIEAIDSDSINTSAVSTPEPKNTYALVYIYKGKSSLKDVIIEGESILDVVNKRLKEKESEKDAEK